MSNVNQVRTKAPKITLLDGIEHTLRYTLNSMAELEDIYGHVDKAFEALNKGSMKAIRNVLWAGLLHEENPYTVQQVGNLIDMDLMADLQSTMNEAMTGSMPDVETVEVVQAKVIDPNA